MSVGAVGVRDCGGSQNCLLLWCLISGMVSG